MKRRIAVSATVLILLTGCAEAAEQIVPEKESLPLGTQPDMGIAEAAAGWAVPFGDEPAAVRILLAHDALCTRCTYDSEAPFRHTAYGAWECGAAVCDGYAAAFAALMQAAGVPVLTVTGTAGGIPHAWNLIALDGAWYHIDCTWDDRDDNAVSHEYFLCGDDEMQQTHHWDTEGYPSAAGCTYCYEGIAESMRRKMAAGK